MIEYRMTVHVFGNRPSPAVATYGLREAVKNSEEDIREFVNKHFYVDDALTSLPTADMAVSLLKRTRETLRDEGNIRLHKIASKLTNSLMSSSEFLTASLSPYVATAGLGRFPKTWTVMRYSIIGRSGLLSL
jgi:hypothetical protein